jgi:hypothetical protein
MNNIGEEIEPGKYNFPAYVYRQQSTADGTLVAPASEALMGFWKGNATLTPKSDRLFESKSQFAPALLVVEVTNEGVAPAQIVNAYLRVDESQSDRQPLIRMADPETCSAGWSHAVNLWNDGWGVAEQASLEFAFGRDGASTDPFRTALGNIGNVAFFPDRALESLAPELRALRTKRPKCTREGRAACLAKLEQEGHLGKLSGQLRLFKGTDTVTTKIVGTLSYQWKDVSGAVKTREQPFRQDIGVFDFDTGAGPECGAAGPGEAGFDPIKLPTDRKAYRQPLPYRGPVGARAVRRLELTLMADRASQHSFAVVVETSDGRVATSQPIKLLYFIPREDRGGMREVR